MKFEEVIEALRQGKRIFHLNSDDLGLQYDPENEKVIQSFCLEIFDILSDDWEIE